MNDIRKQYICWFLIALLFAGYIVINNIVFLKLSRQESENGIKTLIENIDELKMLLEVNQSKVEKRVFDLKRSLNTQYEQSDDNLRQKKLAKLLLLVVKMKNSLLQEAKFDNHIDVMRSIISEFDDPEIDGALNELESLKEIDTLPELRLSFEKAVDTINYSKSTLIQKIISNWIKVRDKKDPLRVKLAEIEESIDGNNWQNIANIVSDLTTYQELKLWLNKLNCFTTASKSISTIYYYLLQYIS